MDDWLPLYDDDFDRVYEVGVDDARNRQHGLLATDGVFTCVATGIRTRWGNYLTHTSPTSIDETDPYLEGILSTAENLDGTAVHVAGPETDHQDLQAAIETLDRYDHDLERYTVRTEDPGSLAIDDDGFYRYDPAIRFER